MQSSVRELAGHFSVGKTEQHLFPSCHTVDKSPDTQALSPTFTKTWSLAPSILSFFFFIEAMINHSKIPERARAAYYLLISGLAMFSGYQGYS